MTKAGLKGKGWVSYQKEGPLLCSRGRKYLKACRTAMTPTARNKGKIRGKWQRSQLSCPYNKDFLRLTGTQNELSDNSSKSLCSHKMRVRDCFISLRQTGKSELQKARKGIISGGEMA